MPGLFIFKQTNLAFNKPKYLKVFNGPKPVYDFES